MVNSTEQTPSWGFTFPLDMMRMMLLLPSLGKRTKHGGKIRASAHQFRDGMLTRLQNSCLGGTSFGNVLL